MLSDPQSTKAIVCDPITTSTDALELSSATSKSTTFKHDYASQMPTLHSSPTT